MTVGGQMVVINTPGSSNAPEHVASADYATRAGIADRAALAENLTDSSLAWEKIDSKDAATLAAAIADAASKYLSKLNPDTAQALITFLQGIAFGNGTYGIDGNGDAILHAINAQEALFDTLTAANAHFFNLIIDEVKSVGGQLIITPANCTAVDVQRNLASDDTLYRVFFRAEDEDKATVNQWAVGDQAIHYEFDVTAGTTRNYWRLVKAVSSEPVSVELPTGESVMCHWIDLSGNDCKSGSDLPYAGDDIAQLGNRNDAARQNAIIISAYNIPFIDTAPYMGDAAGIKAPLFASYNGINSYNIAQGNRVNVIARNGNLFRGEVHIEEGSTLSDGRDVNALGTEDGNLLLNTYFGGDYESEESGASVDMNADTPLWSDPLKHWTVSGGVNAGDYADAKSGRCVSLTEGVLSQPVSTESGAWYMLSFHASGSALSVSVGGRTETLQLTAARTRYDISVESDGTSGVTFSGSAILSDIIMTKGTLPVEWSRSPLDPDKAKADDIANDYLRKAISEASTSILGGLILSNIIKVGNYRLSEATGQWEMSQETGGMSGARNNDNSPFLWGGGDMVQAIHTIDKYKRNPAYEATPEEVAAMAQFVVTHGGRAILNDVILRGYIYALGGKFTGTVEATGGVFKNITTPNGSWSVDNVGNAVFRGVDGMYEIRIDASTRQLSIWGPSKTAGEGSFDPDPTAEKVELMNLGNFVHDGLTSVAPQIWMRRYCPNSPIAGGGLYEQIIKLDPANGIAFVTRTTSGGHVAETTSVLISSYDIFVEGNGVTSPLHFRNLPTSPAALTTGDVWNDNGTLKIVT